VKPSTEAGLHYGPIATLYSVMYQGYSAMPSQYACVFGGKDPNQRCGDGIKVDIEQVRLPKTLGVYPVDPDDEFTTNKKWVRKESFIALLDDLRRAQ
jgi:hypothetical protein